MEMVGRKSEIGGYRDSTSRRDLEHPLSVFPSLRTVIVCGPAASFNVVGVLPRNAPFTSISAPVVGDVIVIEAGLGAAAGSGCCTARDAFCTP